MYLFLAFLLVPLIEIALFIQVGGLIGLWPTLGIVVLTAVLGTWLVRTQGRMAIGKLQRSFSELNDPTEPLAHGAMILISGALLLTPGFFTDAVGFALLVPAVRQAVFRYLQSRVVVHQFQMGASPRHTRNAHHSDGDVIDADYEEIRPPRDPNAPPLGWVDDPKRH
jgi:UPF0716 protein FxsA